MRRLLFFLLFPILIWSCGDDDEISFSTDCLPGNLQNSVIAFYSFSNGSLLDLAGGNDLVNPTNAQAGTDRFGNPDCAFQFDNPANNPDYLTRNDANFLNNLGSFSVSLWYQPIDSTRGGGDFEILLSRGEESHCPNRRGEWSLGLYDCRRAVFGHNNSVWIDRLADPFGCEEEIIENTGQWVHLVAVKNNDDYKIYRNGVLNGSNSGNASCSPLHLAEDTGELIIGKYYKGLIDDIIIYKKALTDAEVQQLADIEPCCL